ncbi:MAG: DUF4399 domain-containing protein [Xanthobacteraceae bacterium]
MLCAALALLPAAAWAQGRAVPEGALLYIIWPEDGMTVMGEFWCRFGLRNMGVARAGDDFPNAGHHHLLIDTDEPIDPSEPIPHDRKHLHFGGGETEALVDLPPGTHTLQLVLGDGEHFPFIPPLTSRPARAATAPRQDCRPDDLLRVFNPCREATSAPPKRPSTN